MKPSEQGILINFYNFMKKFSKLFIALACLLSASAANAQTSGSCGANLTWQLTGEGDNLTLTISGTGAMTDYVTYATAPWYSQWTNIQTLIIGNGVTSIGNWAFDGLQFLTSVTIPNSITSIGNRAFTRCHLSKIEVQWATPLTIPSDVFDVLNGYPISNSTLVVPTGKVAQYQAANVWKGFGTIKERVPATGITLNQTSATMIVSQPLQPVATLTPANATSQIRWTSSNMHTATVNGGTGVVTAKCAGTFIITATEMDGGHSASCTVTATGNSIFNISALPSNDVDDDNRFNDVNCLVYSFKPKNLKISYDSYTQTMPVKVNLCVCKREFIESKPVNTSFEIYGNSGKYQPTLDDLVKIKEYTVNDNLTWYNYSQCYHIDKTLIWDGMTDPAFTDGISYPVHAYVYVVITDAQTGDVVYFYNHPSFFANRYRGYDKVTFTTGEHSVVCDIYFSSQLPIKKAVPVLGDDCIRWNADWTQLRKGGVEKMALSLFSRNNFSESEVGAYQVFDNLTPDENNIYHVSWEIKDLQGKYLDVYNYFNSNYNISFGLYVEGGGQQKTFPLELPEYGAATHPGGDYSLKPNTTYGGSINPLKLDAVVNYPEFVIENSVLMHYHGTGGNVIIPNTVNKIYDLAFYKHTTITGITIPASVLSIGDFAFLNCTGLHNIAIPASVTCIGDYAFANCPLNSVYCFAAQPPSLDINTFYGLNLHNVTLHVPVGTKALYQAADVWKDFKIVDDATAMENISLENLKIFPNPAKDEIFITSEYPIEKVEICDLSGRQVMVNSRLSNGNSINVSSLAKGIYIVKVYTSKGMIGKKIVK